MADKTTGKLKLWLAKMSDKISDTINIYLSENFSKIDDEFSSLKDDVDEHKADDASTTAKGHVQLNDTVTSTSTTQAATANAVKTVNDALTSHKNDKATEEDLGHVKVDGETIQIDENGIISGSITQNKNLLHNWDFRNPVNQRGQTSYAITDNEYTIDRWKGSAADGTITINSDSITLNATETNFEFGQKVEFFEKLNGETLTLSVDVDGTIYSGTAVVDTTLDSTPINVNIGSTGYKLQLRIIPGGSLFIVRLFAASAGLTLANVKAMKLELGSTSTLANDPPADYGEQLALCQRYFQKVYVLRPIVSCVLTRLEFMVPLSVPMRTIPTIESYDVPVWFRVDGTQYTGSSYIAPTGAASVLDSNYDGLSGAISIILALDPNISEINNKLGNVSFFRASLSADL